MLQAFFYLKLSNLYNELKIFVLFFGTGEQMLSPLVECGPRGLEFRKAVELKVPHNATPAHRLALKATDTENRKNADWLNVKLPEPSSDHVIVRLDHF